MSASFAQKCSYQDKNSYPNSLILPPVLRMVEQHPVDEIYVLKIGDVAPRKSSDASEHEANARRHRADKKARTKRA
ncbi:hypothetical protein QFZ99_004703 [Paraburkholderia atlantica]|uniref:hypothetical protein n=1 Tax=Paraburkholderia atlantica TaxID=2654982 RepID=UPI003D1C499B